MSPGTMLRTFKKTPLSPLSRGMLKVCSSSAEESMVRDMSAPTIM